MDLIENTKVVIPPSVLRTLKFKWAVDVDRTSVYIHFCHRRHWKDGNTVLLDVARHNERNGDLISLKKGVFSDLLFSGTDSAYCSDFFLTLPKLELNAKLKILSNDIENLQISACPILKSQGGRVTSQMHGLYVLNFQNCSEN